MVISPYPYLYLKCLMHLKPLQLRNKCHLQPSMLSSLIIWGITKSRLYGISTEPSIYFNINRRCSLNSEQLGNTQFTLARRIFDLCSKAEQLKGK